MRIKFSIITCTWNSAKYLPDNIASVLNQTYDNIEYIFIDGGSTDGTREMIESIPRAVKLMTGVNTGISNAMNRGIEEATGDVVIHLHSDDYFHGSTVLQRAAELFTSQQCGWLVGLITSEPHTQARHGTVLPYSYDKLLRGNMLSHPATFLKRSLFDRVGAFDPKLKYAMDYDLWLRLGRVTSPYQVDDIFTFFRRHSGSASTANDQAAFLEDFSVRMKYSGGVLLRAEQYTRFLKRRIQRMLP